MTRDPRRHRPPRAHWFSAKAPNAGFTLVELLLSIALAALITAFVSNGLGFGIRAWESSERAEAVLNDGALETAISGWVSGALMVKRDPAARDAGVLFAGGPAGLRFISLSDGETQRAGLLEVAIATVPGQRSGTTDLSIAKRIFHRNQTTVERDGESRKTGTAIEFSYFGLLPGERAPRWSANWIGFDHLPLLVGFRLTDHGAAARAMVIARIGNGEMLVHGSAP